MIISNNLKIITFIRSMYKGSNAVSLHDPVFIGNEKEYLNTCITSTFVSYIGRFVSDFEAKIAQLTGAKYAIAVSSGTAALHLSLIVAGVRSDDEVITQALTFVATANAISYTGATCIFLDSDKNTLGMDPDKLKEFLQNNVVVVNKTAINKTTKKRIAACVPVHVFGHPCRIDTIVSLCRTYYIEVIEDSTESMGSYYKGKHTGTFGTLGVFSFNGNKIITTGGGGMIVTNKARLAKRVKYLSTTAKKKHPWEFIHTELGYNYRMPNTSAAIGCAQAETLNFFLTNKRKTAKLYEKFFSQLGVGFFTEPQYCHSNYWLNTLIFKNHNERERFLKYSNEHGVATRPVWRLIHKLPMYKNCQTDDLKVALWLEKRIVNIPSGVRL